MKLEILTKGIASGLKNFSVGDNKKIRHKQITTSAKATITTTLKEEEVL